MIPFFQPSRRADFERRILPHLDAAYSLARFLLRNETNAEDAVQEASLRAFRFYENFRGENARAWFLQIVRNVCFNSLKQTRAAENEIEFDETVHTPAQTPAAFAQDRQVVRAAIAQLAPEFREVIVLRELEDFSYKEIADIAGVPLGTVMSRLARARTQLQQLLAKTFA